MSFEEYGFDSSDLPASKPAEVKPQQQQNNYGNNQGSYRSNSGSAGNSSGNTYSGGNSGNTGGNVSSGGGYSGGNGGFSNGGGGGGFRKGPSKEVVTDQAYSPVSFYVDRSFSKEVKDKLRELIYKFVSKQYIVRVNGDDKEFIESLKDISDSSIEVYLAWRNFNEIDSKHYYNTETSGLIAAKFFSSWDKVSSQVQAFLQRNIRMLFGDKNHSCTKILVTWSEDGASKSLEVTTATGKASHVIRSAAFYSIPVFNTSKSGCEEALMKMFNLM